MLQACGAQQAVHYVVLVPNPCVFLCASNEERVLAGWVAVCMYRAVCCGVVCAQAC